MGRDLESTSRVAKVGKLDGRSRVVRVYRGAAEGWRRPPRRERFTPESVARLKADGVRSVELRRGFRRARMPLAWIPERRLADEDVS